MISDFFGVALYDPLYNSLVFFIDIVPAASVGLAVIILTVVVKLILFPLSLKAVRTQLAVRALEPELNLLKEKYKKDKQEQAKQTMELYRARRINPFAGIVVIFIQLPIIFALYWVFLRGGLPVLDMGVLYDFTPIPSVINMNFLWVDDIAGKSLIFALLAGVTQYFQIRLTLPPMKARSGTANFKEDMARSFQLQMRYVMPIIVVVIAYVISAAVALYWLTSNLFAIGQEIVVKKHMRGKTPPPPASPNT